MGRVSNETNLIVALLKEKAETQKKFLWRKASLPKELDEKTEEVKGIDWTLNTLYEIIEELSNKK